jgi:hypothetical protein
MALKWLKIIFKIFYKIQVKNFAKNSGGTFHKKAFLQKVPQNSTR